MKILAGVLLVFASCLAFGGETPVQGYLSCQSAANQDTIYFSSTWDGSTNNDGNAFTQYLNTKYGYKGSANCTVAYKAYTTVPKLQEQYNAVVAQWRSQGKKIVETGWTNNGAAALTTGAPDGPVAPVSTTPKAHVPDPDDQPMVAKKNVTPPPAMAHSATAPSDETYVFCFSTGSPYRGTAKSHYYVTGIFAASNSHADGPFGVYLHKQHPNEGNQAQCILPGPMSTVENTRRTYIENEHKSFPDRDVVELNWKPMT